MDFFAHNEGTYFSKQKKEKKDMRITNYRIELDDEDRRTVLVKECAKNYPGINTFNTPSSTYKMICDVFHADRLAEEHVWILCLDTKLHLIGVFELSHGTSNCSLIGAREIFTRICLCGAAAFIIVHNHPSGDPEASVQDIKRTEELEKASKIMGITLCDHITIGDGCYTSLKEIGRLS